MYPADLKYTKDHEWIRIAGSEGRIGITDYAQKELGEIVYVDLPEVGRTLQAGEVFGSVESVKAVSELFSPVSGEVIEVNTSLGSSPETINKDPHNAWMIAVRMSKPDETSSLLDSRQYSDLVK